MGDKSHRVLVVAVATDGIAQQIRQAAGHAGAQIHSRRTQNHGDASRHIFATVLANAFDDGERAAVAHRKTFAHSSRNVQFPAGRAVEQGVAGKHVAARRSFFSGGDGDRSSGKALAYVVVGFAQQTGNSARSPETRQRSVPRCPTNSYFAGASAPGVSP